MPLVKIRDIHPNPFRHSERYPIKSEKVAALRESMRSTDYWGNILARKKNGKIEIAYGHHRLIALKAEFAPDHKVELIIRDLDDDKMLEIMARENMEVWKTSAAVALETVRATVEAYAAEIISLSPPRQKTPRNQIRYAPSFILGDVGSAGNKHPYTAATIGERLGWLYGTDRQPARPLKNALSALGLIETGILKESDFDELTNTQAERVVEEARKVTPAKAANRGVELNIGRQKALPHINDGVIKLTGEFMRFYEMGGNPAKKLDEVIENKEYVESGYLSDMKTEIKNCVARLIDYAERI